MREGGKDQATEKEGESMSVNRRQFLARGAAAASAGLAVPAVLRAAENRTFRWRMATSYPAGLPVYQVGPGGAEDFARRVKEMSGGRLDIKVFSAGEIMPAFEVFDNTSAGNIQLHYSNSYYWSGKTFAAQYFTTVPFGMSYQGHTAWLTQGGGIELWHEVYEPFNLVAFPSGSTGTQMGGWFKKPFESAEDLKGLKFRIPGLAGKIYSQVGVNVVLLPGGEIFPSLERGVIDAAEWVGPYQDQRLGLQDAAKFYYAADWHEPATTTEVAINKGAWDELPDDLKAVVKNAALACHLMAHMQSEAKNPVALQDLVQDKGVRVLRVPASVQQTLYAAALDFLRDEAKKDPLVKKVNNSYWKFKKLHDPWQDASETAFQTVSRDIPNEDDLIV
jgi:TRAP-type mannitol/chloroaromatic compound transport system substrate-binding protein